MKQIRNLILIFLILGNPILGAIDTTVDMSMNAVTQKGKDSWNFEIVGNVYTRLTFQNKEQERLKALFSIEANVSDSEAMFGIYQAYVKFVIANVFRYTMGKAPISWGQGVYFNAGDILFSSINPTIDFTSLVTTDNNSWVIVPYFALGERAFFELLLATPHLSLLDNIVIKYSGGIIPIDVSRLHWDKISGGGRFSWTMGDVDWQIGALYIGEIGGTRPYLSMGGGIAETVDWYLSSRLEVQAEEVGGNWYKRWELTGGLSFPWIFEDGSSLSLRLEGIFRPYGLWNWKEKGKDKFLEENKLVGSQLYFELSYSPNSFFSLEFRNIYSIIDTSTLFNLGLSIVPYQDLTIAFNSIVQLGLNRDSLFTLNKEGGLIFSLSMRYVFD